MRLISLILSLYIVFLVNLPCADSQDHAAAGMQQTTENHRDHTHDTESCSPLCVCACCTSYAYFTEIRQEIIPQVEVSKPELPYRKSFHSYDCRSIWQPPKIG